jgi:hypothetical protein
MKVAEMIEAGNRIINYQSKKIAKLEEALILMTNEAKRFRKAYEELQIRFIAKSKEN